MIRRFHYADLDRILEIERHAFPKSPYDRGTFVSLQWLYPDSFLVYVQIDSDRKESEIVGYIVFSRDGHIISIAVDPLWRRKGVGRALVETIFQDSRIRKVWAEVRTSNTGAQAFYRRLGFEVIGRAPNYYGDEDALIIQRRLPPAGEGRSRPRV